MKSPNNIIVACTFLLTLAALPLHGADVDDLTYNASGAGVIITDCDTAASGELVIPNTIEGKPVTSIGDFAFRECSSLTSITIGDGVTSIGYAACYQCSALTSLTIGNGVTSIGEHAFRECSALTRVTIGDSVTSIGDFTFAFCGALTEITFLGNAPTLEVFAGNAGPNPFWQVAANATITVRGDATGFGDTFGGLPVVKAELIPVGLTYDASGATVIITGYDTTLSGELVIPAIIEGKPVTSIGYMAFEDCALTSLVIPDSVTNIGAGAFFRCTSLTNITIPDDLTSIGGEAGDGAWMDGEEWGVFYECTSLTSFTIGADNANYTKVDGVLFNKEKTVLVAYPPGDQRTNYIIPDSVTSIKSGAFDSCENLRSIRIPDSVTSLGWWAFDGCTSLASIIIPDGLTSIDGGAFNACGALTSVTIPDSVTSIGDGAFAGCSSLTSITIGNGVTSIGGGAFSDCSSLTSIIFLGNAPGEDRGDIFGAVAANATITVSADATGFGDTFAGLPVVRFGGFADDHGDTREHATTIAQDSTTAGVIESENDLDYFRIAVSAGGLLTVRTTGSTDTYGTLLNSGGTVLAVNDEQLRADDDAGNFQISYFVTPGTYYVGVESGWWDTGPYELESSLQVGARDDFGNTLAEAKSIGMNSTTNGNLEVSDDVDVFRIVASSAGLLTVRTTGTTDTYGTLLNSGGTEICADDDGEFTPEPGDDNDNDSDHNFLIRYLVQPGTYYMMVEGESDDDRRDDDVTTTGRYQLVSSMQTGFEDDHGDTLVRATRISASSQTEGNITYCNDLDYFRIDVDIAGVLTFQATGDADTIQSLLGSDESVLATGTWNPVSHTVTPGTYYLVVRVDDEEDDGWNDTGTYRLETSFVSILSLSPVARSIGAGGGDATFNVTSNTSWSWSDDAPWLTSSEATTQDGNQAFSYSVAANTSTRPRSATITITAGNITRTHTLTQEGDTDTPIFSLNVSASRLPSGAIDQITVSFPATITAVYSIEGSADMRTWVTLEAGINGRDNIIERSYPVGGAMRYHGFYRVRRE